MKKMTNEEYFKHPAISNSDLTLINDSVEHYEYKKANPTEPTAAMKFGTDFHCYVLEPEVFEKTYIVIPDDMPSKNSNAYKAWFLEIDKKKKKPIEKETLEAFAIMKAKIDKTGLLVDGVAEEPLFGEYTVLNTPVPIRCKPDYRTPTHIIDLKTTVSASPVDFEQSVRKYRYFVQQAFYLEIARQKFPLIEGFIFIAIESSAPYSLACYELKPVYNEIGKMQFHKDLEKYVTAMRTGRKGYDSGVNLIEPPSWFVNQYS